jgi:hypothetical protein
MLTAKCHPVTELFPPLDEAVFQLLSSDIEQNGLRVPIWTYNGQIIDGRSRQAACENLGIKPLTREYEGDDLIGFVVSLNLHRRHLTESQRAMIAAQLTSLSRGRRKIDQLAYLPTQREAADLLKVSETTIKRAVSVRDRAIPEVREAVERGHLAVSAAAEIARLPEPAQHSIATAGLTVIAEKARQLRDAKRKTLEKLATLPTPEAALDRSRTEGAWIRASDGQMHLYVEPDEVRKWDVWLGMKPHVIALAAPLHSAEAFAASADSFWLPIIPKHIDAAVAYLLEVKRQLELIHG